MPARRGRPASGRPARLPCILCLGFLTGTPCSPHGSPVWPWALLSMSVSALDSEGLVSRASLPTGGRRARCGGHKGCSIRSEMVGVSPLSCDLSQPALRTPPPAALHHGPHRGVGRGLGFLLSIQGPWTSFLAGLCWKSVTGTPKGSCSSPTSLSDGRGCSDTWTRWGRGRGCGGRGTWVWVPLGLYQLGVLGKLLPL